MKSLIQTSLILVGLVIIAKGDVPFWLGVLGCGALFTGLDWRYRK